ncbi:MAG: FecR family protein [Pseudomonadales bacterium]
MSNIKPLCYALWMLLLCAVNPALADTATQKAGTFKVVSGTVEVVRNGEVRSANIGDTLHVGDQVVTSAASFAGITLYDNTRLTAGPSSSLVIDAFAFSTTTHEGELSASVAKGSLAVISGQLAKANPEKVVFNTNTMTVGVRGTEFIIEAHGE